MIIEQRDRLVDILIAASRRGEGETLTKEEAEDYLECMAADPTHEVWETVREPGRSLLRHVLAQLTKETER